MQCSKIRLSRRDSIRFVRFVIGVFTGRAMQSFYFSTRWQCCPSTSKIFRQCCVGVEKKKRSNLRVNICSTCLWKKKKKLAAFDTFTTNLYWKKENKIWRKRITWCPGRISANKNCLMWLWEKKWGVYDYPDVKHGYEQHALRFGVKKKSAF